MNSSNDYLQSILDKWMINISIDDIFNHWSESHRYYHTLEHLNDLISQIESDKQKYSDKEYEMLLITALFHDIVYDPLKRDNEERSADFFIKSCTNITSDIKVIKQAILDTQTHLSTTDISEQFNKYDMNIVERPLNDLLEWEKGIYNEFKSFGDKYKTGRLSFLKSLLPKYPNNIENLSKLIQWVEENY